MADSGYCATKKLYFYGVRVHVIGSRQPDAEAVRQAKNLTVLTPVKKQKG
ncbi:MULTISPECIES: hypothetical protein [Methylobacter]|nr:MULTISPECIES: hypothetical protein [Methylobacter]